MAKIKIGQFGVGHAHARGKIQAFRGSSDFEVVGVVEPDATLRRAAQSQKAYQGLSWMTAEQLLNVKNLKAVAVETRVPDLLKTAELCLHAGKHIHLDKPAGFSLKHFKKILDTAAAKHLLVQMGYMYRYNPGVVLLRNLLRKGWLGKPFEVHAVMGKVMSRNSRKSLESMPGGIMFELGCHVIDLVVGVLGRPEKIDSFSQHASPIPDKLQDNMLAVFTYPRAIASVKSNCNEIEGFARRHLVVCGTEGTLHLQPFSQPSVRLALSRNRGKYRKGYQDVSLPKYTRYLDDVKDMARVIRGEKDADFSYEHDDHVQESLLKASGLSTNS